MVMVRVTVIVKVKVWMADELVHEDGGVVLKLKVRHGQEEVPNEPVTGGAKADGRARELVKLPHPHLVKDELLPRLPLLGPQMHAIHLPDGGESYGCARGDTEGGGSDGHS